MSTVKALYHIVISTKNRQRTITEAHKRDLYKYIYGIINNKQCRLMRMNGVENHIHILLQLHPAVALADLMHEIKRSSSYWMKRQANMFPLFKGWGKEYAAFTCAARDQANIIEYIKNQEIHHGTVDYEQEMVRLAEEHGCQWVAEYADK